MPEEDYYFNIILWLYKLRVIATGIKRNGVKSKKCSLQEESSSPVIQVQGLVHICHILDRVRMDN